VKRGNKQLGFFSEKMSVLDHPVGMGMYIEGGTLRKRISWVNQRYFKLKTPSSS